MAGKTSLFRLLPADYLQLAVNKDFLAKNLGIAVNQTLHQNGCFSSNSLIEF